jgi:hypothetical protein
MRVWAHGRTASLPQVGEHFFQGRSNKPQRMHFFWQKAELYGIIGTYDVHFSVLTSSHKTILWKFLQSAVNVRPHIGRIYHSYNGVTS